MKAETPSERDPEYTMRNHPDALKLREWHDAAYALMEAVETLLGESLVCDAHQVKLFSNVDTAKNEARRCWDAMVRK